MITREQLTGAIRLVNANGLKPRIDHLRKLLEAQDPSAVEKILSDLDSYSDWGARKDLDAGT